MKKIINFVLALVMAFCLVVSPALAATGEVEEVVNQADVDLLTSANETLLGFAEAIDGGESDDNLIIKIDEIVLILQQVSEHSFSQEVSQEYLNKTNVVKSQAVNLKQKFKELSEAYQMDVPDDALSVLVDQVGESINEYTDAVNAIEDAMPAATDGSEDFYLILLLAMATLAFGSFVWAFMWPEKIPERIGIRYQVAYMSLIPLAGAAVIYFGNHLASTSGDYMASWGAIFFGLAIYVRNILSYRKIAEIAD